jgi:hypothetical protein
MSNPPTPPATDPNDHAPGVSKTLEENAAHSREVQEAERDKAQKRKALDPGGED